MEDNIIYMVDNNMFGDCQIIKCIIEKETDTHYYIKAPGVKFKYKIDKNVMADTLNYNEFALSYMDAVHLAIGELIHRCAVNNERIQTYIVQNQYYENRLKALRKESGKKYVQGGNQLGK